MSVEAKMYNACAPSKCINIIIDSSDGAGQNVIQCYYHGHMLRPPGEARVLLRAPEAIYSA